MAEFKVNSTRYNKEALLGFKGLFNSKEAVLSEVCTSKFFHAPTPTITEKDIEAKYARFKRQWNKLDPESLSKEQCQARKEQWKNAKLQDLEKVKAQWADANTQNLREAKGLIEYALFATPATIINDEWKSRIDFLRSNRSSYSVGHKNCTTSMVDFAALIYILYLSLQPEGGRDVKKAFALGFTSYFKKFLTDDIGIEDAALKLMPDQQINAIQYNGGIQYIKFNHLKLDISQIFGEKLFTSPVQHGIKNYNFRSFFSENEILDKKTAAKTYYNYLYDKVSQISDNKKRQTTILQLIYFNKTLNVLQRKQIKAEETYPKLINLIPKELAQKLKLKSYEEKLEFINHSMFLNFHRNTGIYFKRYLLKAPCLLVMAGCLFLSNSSILANAYDTMKALGGYIGYGTMIGGAVEAGNDFTMLGPNIYAASQATTNAGDSNDSYTNGIEGEFVRFINIYNSVTRHSSYTKEWFRNDNYYKLSEAWQQVPETKNIIALSDSDLDIDKQYDIHTTIMANMFDFGFDLRRCDLTKIETKTNSDQHHSKYGFNAPTQF